MAVTHILITNEQGEVAFAGEGATSAGDHVFTWDGRDSAGMPQPDGKYTISVSARDAEDRPVAATTRIGGRVGGIETIGGELNLVVDGITVPFENVVAVTETSES